MVFSCIHHSANPQQVEDRMRGSMIIQKLVVAQGRKVNISAMFARNMVIAGGIAKMVILMT
jgi:hypothetical protein